MFQWLFLLLGLSFIPLFSVSHGVYVFQPGTPVAMPNFLQPGTNCNYTGVAGQVFNQQGNPVSGYIIEITGIFQGVQILRYGVSGGSIRLGAGGYDIELADKAVSSQGSLRIRLLNVLGVPVSPALIFNTYADCQQNLVLVNFLEIAQNQIYYFPWMTR